MLRNRNFLNLVVLTVSVAALGAGCWKPKSTRWDEKAAEVEEKGAPVVDKATVAKGESFNAFFPKEEGGVSRTFTQEKTGFVEAKIEQDGKSAKLSISDTNNNPSAKSKFEKSTTSVGGHPLVTVGSKQSALLVADRWQVKVSSSDFDEAQRKKILETFDLAGLAAFSH